jgi:hypothetical protein
MLGTALNAVEWWVSAAALNLDLGEYAHLIRFESPRAQYFED